MCDDKTRKQNILNFDLKMALEAALARCLILDSGATLAFFVGPSCVVLEASGVAYTLVRPPRLPGDAPHVEAHGTRFTPVKQRPLVLKALRFRNQVASDPYVPSWMVDAFEDDSSNGEEDQMLSQRDVAHWPSVDDISRVPPDLARRTSDGGVEVRSLEGQAIIKLCPLGRRLSFTFRAAVQSDEGHESGRSFQGYAASQAQMLHPSRPAVSQDRTPPKGVKSIPVMQSYSVKMVPPCLEVPARLALQIWNNGTTQDSRIVAGDERERPPLAFVAARLPSTISPHPPPEWHSIDIGHVSNSSTCLSRVADGEDHEAGPQLHRHRPSLSADEVLTLAAHAEKQWASLQAKTQRADSIVDAPEEEEEKEALYPSTYGTRIEWTPETTFVALPDSSNSGAEACNKKRLVEVTVHCDDSILILDGNYVTRTSLRKRPLEIVQDAPSDAQGYTLAATTAALSSVGCTDNSADSVINPRRYVEERLLHTNVTPYIRIDLEDDAFQDSPQPDCRSREYCLGPLVARAIRFRSQLRLPPNQKEVVQPHQAGNLHWRQQPMSKAQYPAQSPARPRSGLSAAFADSSALAYQPNNGRGDIGIYQESSTGAVVRTEVVAAGRFSLYADGTVRGAFTDRTLAVLTPRPHPRCPGAAHHCCLVLPDGAEVLLPVTPWGGSDNNNSSTRTRFAGSSYVRPTPPPRFEMFAPIVALLQRWGRIAGQGPEAQAADAQQRANAQAAIAKELRRTSVFVRREALKQTPPRSKSHAMNASNSSVNSSASTANEKENGMLAHSEGTAVSGTCAKFGATLRNIPLRLWGEFGSTGAREALTARAASTGRSEDA